MKEIRKYHDVTGLNIFKIHTCYNLDDCKCDDFKIEVTSEFKLGYHAKQNDMMFISGESYQIELKWLPASRKWICILKNNTGFISGKEVVR